MELKYNNNFDINLLIINPKNPKQHSEEQVLELSKKITKFGFNQNILINDRNMIIAGHGRRLAALKLGLKTVPVTILPGLSDLESLEAMFSDNAVHSMTTMDTKIMADLINELALNDIDLSAFNYDFKTDYSGNNTELSLSNESDLKLILKIEFDSEEEYEFCNSKLNTLGKNKKDTLINLLKNV